MSKKQILDNAIVKSATGPDETRFLLSAVDAVLSEEIEAQDTLLLAEIDELQDLCNKLINVVNAQAKEIEKLEQEESELKNAFKNPNTQQ